jgi:hypothetical protein
MQNRIFFKFLFWGELFLFLILLAVGLYLFGLSQSSKALPDAIPGMQRTSAISLLISPFWLVPAVGIRRKAPWGWWVGLSVNLFAFLLLTWAFGFNPIDGDLSSIAFPGTFLVLTTLHLFSRPTTWKQADTNKYPTFAKKTT